MKTNDEVSQVINEYNKIIFLKCNSLLPLLFFRWFYKSLWTLPSATILIHFLLSFVNLFEPLVPVVARSGVTLSIHLFLSRPLLLLPYNLPSHTFSLILVSSVVSTCPSQIILCDLMNNTISFPSVLTFSDSSIYFVFLCNRNKYLC